MTIDVSGKAICKIDIDSYEAFRILCRSLNMGFVLDEDTDYHVKRNEFGYLVVYYIDGGHDEVFDDRGELFVALRNVAVQMFPNTAFRSASYIYKMED